MTTIHMDAEAARTIQRKLLQLQTAIMNDIRKPNVTVASLQSSWRSTSADEFFALYNESSGHISEVASKLGEIAAEILQEIEQWESTADRLSS